MLSSTGAFQDKLDWMGFRLVAWSLHTLFVDHGAAAVCGIVAEEGNGEEAAVAEDEGAANTAFVGSAKSDWSVGTSESETGKNVLWKGSAKDGTTKGEAAATPSDAVAAGTAFLEFSSTTGTGLAGTTMVMVADCSPQKN